MLPALLLVLGLSDSCDLWDANNCNRHVQTSNGKPCGYCQSSDFGGKCCHSLPCEGLTDCNRGWSGTGSGPSPIVPEEVVEDDCADDGKSAGNALWWDDRLKTLNDDCQANLGEAGCTSRTSAGRTCGWCESSEFDAACCATLPCIDSLWGPFPTLLNCNRGWTGPGVSPPCSEYQRLIIPIIYLRRYITVFIYNIR